MNYKDKLKAIIKIANEVIDNEYRISELKEKIDGSVTTKYSVKILDQNDILIIESYSNINGWNKLYKNILNRMIVVMFNNLNK